MGVFCILRRCGVNCVTQGLSIVVPACFSIVMLSLPKHLVSRPFASLRACPRLDPEVTDWGNRKNMLHDRMCLGRSRHEVSLVGISRSGQHSDGIFTQKCLDVLDGVAVEDAVGL